MHWAAHGHTAAEIIFSRVDANKVHLGLTHFSGVQPCSSEIITAKNYLSENELSLLNRIVTAYLEFAELQAQRGKLMKISAAQAKQKAKLEYSRFQKTIDVQPTPVDKDLENAIKKLAKNNEKCFTSSTRTILRISFISFLLYIL